MANITVTPQGNIYLCKTKLENDYKNQLTFTNATAQSTYFSGTVQKTYSNYTYVKKDNYVQVSDNIDTIIDCNYMYYRNVGFTTKIYYCFITRMEYINENCTRIYFETDVFQTWQFQIEYKQSFVEREHVNDDTVGLHTVPENLELGDFIINNVVEMDLRSNNFFICMGLSRYPIFPNIDLNDRLYGGIYSGLFYVLFDDAISCSKFIQGMDEEGYGADIYTIFLIPTSLSFSNTWYTVSLGNQTNIRITAVKKTTSATHMVTDKAITINTTLDSYTPINGKLKTYPYNYFYITNNAGADAIYRYEDFTNNTPTFDIDGIITTGCSIKLFPKNYKRTDTSTWKTKCYNYGLVGNKYPTCSWQSDSYTNWLTQNGVNIAIDTGVNLAKIGVGLASGTGVGTYSGTMGIVNTIQQVYQSQFLPMQTKGNTSAGDITASDEMMGFVGYQMSIKSEYAQIIDNYFSAYGYKINRIKVPNITGRTNWNYVKTINCNFDGNIPQSDLQIIKQIFDNGITLWHNPSTMLDYSNTNSIVS